MMTTQQILYLAEFEQWVPSLNLSFFSPSGAVLPAIAKRITYLAQERTVHSFVVALH
jgi:hypothetical protein